MQDRILPRTQEIERRLRNISLPDRGIGVRYLLCVLLPCGALVPTAWHSKQPPALAAREVLIAFW